MLSMQGQIAGRQDTTQAQVGFSSEPCVCPTARWGKRPGCCSQHGLHTCPEDSPPAHTWPPHLGTSRLLSGTHGPVPALPSTAHTLDPHPQSWPPGLELGTGPPQVAQCPAGVTAQGSALQRTSALQKQSRASNQKLRFSRGPGRMAQSQDTRTCGCPF